MKKIFAIFASAALLAAYANQAAAGVLGFSSTTRLPTVAEIGNDAALNGKEIWDFFVSTDTDMIQVDQVVINAGPLYQNGFGTDANPPNPLFIGVAPAVAADSWITTPLAPPAESDTAIAGGGFGDPGSAWFDSDNDGPQVNFNFARLTVPAGSLVNFSGRVFTQGTPDPTITPFSFPLVPDNEAPEVLPDGGQRGTRSPLQFSHQFTFTDDNDSSLDWEVVSFTGPTVPANYSIDGNGLFTWDTTGTPNGNDQVYSLVVRGTDSGDLSDEGSITIIMPEPGTMILAGMGLIGFVTSRRKVA